ncbi:MAG: putative quinol monooxygenase [Bacteroidota bacterium]
MSALVVIAKITAHEGKAEAAKAALLGLVAPTQKEAGFIQYDFHQDLNNPHVFYAYEQWESMAHLQAHGQSAHIKAMQANTKNIIVSSELTFLKKIH